MGSKYKNFNVKLLCYKTAWIMSISANFQMNGKWEDTRNFEYTINPLAAVILPILMDKF